MCESETKKKENDSPCDVVRRTGHWALTYIAVDMQTTRTTDEAFGECDALVFSRGKDNQDDVAYSKSKSIQVGMSSRSPRSPPSPPPRLHRRLIRALHGRVTGILKVLLVWHTVLLPCDLQIGQVGISLRTQKFPSTHALSCSPSPPIPTSSNLAPLILCVHSRQRLSAQLARRVDPTASGLNCCRF